MAVESLTRAALVTSSCAHLHLAVTRAADITELNLPKRATIAFVDGKDKLLHFQITMRPEEGIYRWRAVCAQGASACGACL